MRGSVNRHALSLRGAAEFNPQAVVRIQQTGDDLIVEHIAVGAEADHPMHITDWKLPDWSRQCDLY